MIANPTSSEYLFLLTCFIGLRFCLRWYLFGNTLLGSFFFDGSFISLVF